MKYTLLLCLVALTCYGQTRQDDPIPYISKSPTTELSKGVLGWSKSTDGQWVSDENLIPYRKMARNESPDFNETHKLGLDNMPLVQIYPVVFENDTLVCLVKHMVVGEYNYEMIEKSWKSHNRAHYFLFSSEQLEKLKNIESDKANVVTIDLLDNGNLNDVSPGKISEVLTSTLRVNPDCKRQLILTARSYVHLEEVKGELQKTPRIQFQIHSEHNKTEDLQGVVMDFQIKGKSLYGTPELLDYLYYECTLQQYNDLLTLNGDFKLIK